MDKILLNPSTSCLRQKSRPKFGLHLIVFVGLIVDKAPKEAPLSVTCAFPIPIVGQMVSLFFEVLNILNYILFPDWVHCMDIVFGK